LCCAPGFPGRCCQRRWAAVPGAPAGDGSRHGSEPRFGIGCTRYCCRSFAEPSESTSRGWWPTVLRSAPWVLEKNGTEPNRSPSSRLEAPHPHRREGHSALGHSDQSESKRRHPVAASDPGNSPDRWQTRAASTQTRPRPGRSRLRFEPSSSRAQGARHPVSDCATQNQTRQRPGKDPLGCGTNHRMAALVSPPQNPLRTTAQNSRSVPQNRLLSDLLASTSASGFILKWVLSIS
jgi:hypothetical protein